MVDLEFGIGGIQRAMMVALAGPVFKLSDRMDGETVSGWKTRRKLDRLYGQGARMRAGAVDVSAVGLASGLLMRGHKSGVLTARDISAAERIYRLAGLARICGGAVTSFYGERVGSGTADYERGVAAELAYRAVMAAMPSPACREFIRRVIVEGEGMEAAVGVVVPRGLKTKQNRLGGAWIYLQVGLSSAVAHFDDVGWK